MFKKGDGAVHDAEDSEEIKQLIYESAKKINGRFSIDKAIDAPAEADWSAFVEAAKQLVFWWKYDERYRLSVSTQDKIWLPMSD